MPDNDKLDILQKRQELLLRRIEQKTAELNKKQEELKQYGKGIKDYLNRKADEMAAKYAAEFPPEEQGAALAEIRKALGDEADKLGFYYEKQYEKDVQRFLGKWAMFGRNLAMGTMTMGDIWHQMWSNLWNLLFGPWVIGAGFVILQWFMIVNWVPPSAAKSFLLIMAPLIGGGGVFMLNFMNSKNPMDWLTHIITGFIIAYSVGILLIGIFNGIEHFPGGIMWFWITWFLSGLFVGTFQLYQLGGFRAVMSVAVLILLFGYLSLPLAPYQAAYRQAIDRIKEPFTLAIRAVVTAFNDAWVLATNPTEWYARQQLRNVRTEKPLELPKGIEIVRIDSLTPGAGIPADEEFEVFAVIENKGRLTARDVSARIECNQFCSVPDDVKIFDGKTKPALKKDLDNLEQGRQLQLRFPGLQALKPGKQAFQIAKVTLFVSYTYETTSTLPVKLASNKEIERALAAKEDIFRAVTSIAMDGPSQISLNVGPQPLKTGDSTSLLVAILNARPDGTVILKRDMRVYVDVPNGIGTLGDAACRSGSGQVVCSSGEEEVARCNYNQPFACLNNGCMWDSSCKPLHQATCIVQPTEETIRGICKSFGAPVVSGIVETGVKAIEGVSTELGKAAAPLGAPAWVLRFCHGTENVPDLHIKATDFSTILPIFCSLSTASDRGIDIFKSDRIKASMPSYIFETKKSLDITITQPLGVLHKEAPPVISGISVKEDSNKAVVTWTTNRESRGKVLYGETDIYWKTAEETGKGYAQLKGMLHHAELEIERGKTYHYNIEIEDNNKNKASSGVRTFTVGMAPTPSTPISTATPTPTPTPSGTQISTP